MSFSFATDRRVAKLASGVRVAGTAARVKGGECILGMCPCISTIYALHGCTESALWESDGAGGGSLGAVRKSYMMRKRVLYERCMVFMVEWAELQRWRDWCVRGSAPRCEVKGSCGRGVVSSCATSARKFRKVC